jgi:hypothetical protein
LPSRSCDREHQQERRDIGGNLTRVDVIGSSSVSCTPTTGAAAMLPPISSGFDLILPPNQRYETHIAATIECVEKRVQKTAFDPV